jgi:probable HAF family extracellular repeat protein
MKDLGSLGGVQTASVNGLNERGEVVGGSLLPGDQLNHPFLWDGKQLIDLTAPPFGESLSGEARWINEAGEVVGGAGLAVPCAGLGSQTHGFLWRNGAMTDLGMIAGSPNSQADFINSKTQIVGGSFSCDGAPIAFLWENGSMVDLNTLISPNSPFFLAWAPFIDDHGEIGAFGVLPNGDSHTVLLIPCDESHPNIEGCDYSLAEGNTTTTPSVASRLTPAQARLSRLASRAMRRSSRGSMPLSRGLGAQPLR